MTRTSAAARTQYSQKNEALDEIAKILGLQVNQLKARKMIVELLKFRERLSDIYGIQAVLKEIKDNKLERWSQFSPYLAGEKDWANN
jgi:hypothetical protein